jgi:hypothetical protein
MVRKFMMAQRIRADRPSAGTSGSTKVLPSVRCRENAESVQPSRHATAPSAGSIDVRLSEVPLGADNRVAWSVERPRTRLTTFEFVDDSRLGTSLSVEPPRRSGDPRSYSRLNAHASTQPY